MLQRIARLAPGLTRTAWALLPGQVRSRLRPLVYPIAAGKRGGSLVLRVPWPERSADPSAPVAAGSAPKVSVVIPAHAGRALCEPCLAALLRNTPWPNLEVVVIDNGMSREDSAWLEGVSRDVPEITVIHNEGNVGFARAVNQGLRRASGDIVVLLNDDTAVGPGWLSRLVAHLEGDRSLGLVGASTNEIGNAAKVPASYTDLPGMEALARDRAARYAGKRDPVDTVALFCAAARRETLEAVGLLDERYEVGMFEDDDLCLAIRRMGLGIAIARDAFVHHVGQASFSRLSDDEYLKLWEANRRRFEDKWGVRWSPPP